MTIDINCDLGEGCANDAELMKYVSSANIACGFHAGDSTTMARTVELAVANGVAVGAHPGYRDRENFGRTPMSLSSNEVFEIVVEQIQALQDICKRSATVVRHVKPHGALYNQAAKNNELAAAICEAVASVDRSLIFYGLSGSTMISQAHAAGLKTAAEVFADRTYQPDGSLTPRSESNALITDDRVAMAQALRMIQSQTVMAVTGDVISIQADTICIHGDGDHAVDFAKAIGEAFADAGVKVMSPGSIPNAA